ncbi:HAD-IC family P-type ATPase [Streptomyces sp. NPDC087263]|uniref:HAD-IC family P-type ATPase n=1 Tax=Streptomyces sp. NPDC087263 TaxID=3365773 RepID=UPI0037F8793A
MRGLPLAPPENGEPAAAHLGEPSRTQVVHVGEASAATADRIAAAAAGQPAAAAPGSRPRSGAEGVDRADAAVHAAVPVLAAALAVVVVVRIGCGVGSLADGLVLATGGACLLAALAGARRLVTDRHHGLRAAGARLRKAGLAAGDIVEVGPGDFVPGDARVIDGRGSVCDLPYRHPGLDGDVLAREKGYDRSSVTGGARVLDGDFRLELVSSSRDSLIARSAALLDADDGLTVWWWFGGVLVAEGVVTACAGLLPSAGRAVVSGIDALTAAVLIGAVLLHRPSPFAGLLHRLGLLDLADLGLLARSEKAGTVLAAADVLLIDKNGTLTQGERRAQRLLPAPGVREADLARAVALASLGDDTPEGRSSLDLVGRSHGPEAVAPPPEGSWSSVPFSPQTRISGVDVAGPDSGRRLRKGAPAAVREWARGQGLAWPVELDTAIAGLEATGKTVLVVVSAAGSGPGQDPGVAGAVVFDSTYRADIVGGIRALQHLGVEVVVLTGDSGAVARATAEAVGADGVVAEADPDRKIAEIRAWRGLSATVAVVGDGDNDAPALREADVGIALHSGLAEAKSQADLVDVNSRPAQLAAAVRTARASATLSAFASSWSRFGVLAVILSALVAAGALLATGGHPPLSSQSLSTAAHVLRAAAAASALTIAVLAWTVVRLVPARTPLTEATVRVRSRLLAGAAAILPLVVLLVTT